MILIDDLADDRVVRQVVQYVTERFLNLKESTPRRHVIKKLDGKGKLIASLLRYEFLRQPVNENIVPGFLAFQYSDGESLLRMAKNGTNIVLHVLRNLSENDYSKRQFLANEISSHAEQMFSEVIPQEIFIGMLLVTELSDFVVAPVWDETGSVLKAISIQESIFDFRSIENEWQQKLENIKARQVVPLPEGAIDRSSDRSGRKKSDKFGILDSPSCLE